MREWSVLKSHGKKSTLPKLEQKCVIDISVGEGEVEILYEFLDGDVLLGSWNPLMPR